MLSCGRRFTPGSEPRRRGGVEASSKLWSVIYHFILYVAPARLFTHSLGEINFIQHMDYGFLFSCSLSQLANTTETFERAPVSGSFFGIYSIYFRRRTHLTLKEMWEHNAWVYAKSRRGKENRSRRVYCIIVCQNRCCWKNEKPGYEKADDIVPYWLFSFVNDNPWLCAE